MGILIKNLNLTVCIYGWMRVRSLKTDKQNIHTHKKKKYLLVFQGHEKQSVFKYTHVRVDKDFG